jgi:uncharacterized protein YbjQ (UPF0145 family)
VNYGARFEHEDRLVGALLGARRRLRSDLAQSGRRTRRGSLSGPYTSNARLAEGAFNDMKNEAHEMGANYVVLENTQAGSTVCGNGKSMSGGQTDVTHIGNAFKCPDAPAPAPAAAGSAARPSAASDVVIVGF